MCGKDAIPGGILKPAVNHDSEFDHLQPNQDEKRQCKDAVGAGGGHAERNLGYGGKARALLGWVDIDLFYGTAA